MTHLHTGQYHQEPTAREDVCDRCGRQVSDWPCNDDGSDWVPPEGTYQRKRYDEWLADRPEDPA